MGRQTVRLLNDRMAYVAISRARYDALNYTDSTQNLSEALNREIDKAMALDVTASVTMRHNIVNVTHRVGIRPAGWGH